MIFVIAAMSFMLALLLCWAAVHLGQVWIGRSLIGLSLIALGAFGALSESTQGWEALDHFLATLTIAAPSLLGSSLGYGLGHWTRRRSAGPVAGVVEEE